MQSREANQQPFQTCAGEVDGDLFGIAAALDVLHDALAEGGMADDFAHRQGNPFGLRFRRGATA